MVGIKKMLPGCGIGCFGLIVIVVIALVFLVSCTGSEDEKAFNFIVDEYEAALKKNVSDSGPGTSITMGTKNELEENRYSITLTNSIFAFVEENKDGKVTRVSMAATGDSLVAANKEVLIAFQSLVKSVDSSLSATQFLMLFEKLGITGDSSMLDHKADYSLNGISYAYIGSIEDDSMVLQAVPQK